MESIPSSLIFFGAESKASSSRNRADALRRLGCELTVIDPAKLLGVRNHWQNILDYRTGYKYIQGRLMLALDSVQALKSLKPDLIWVDSGELIGSKTLKYLRKSFSCPFVLYNLDDPTGLRDGARFQSLRSALSLYSLCVFVRPETSLEGLALGALQVLTVHRSYDECVHLFSQLELCSDLLKMVSFVGAYMPGESRGYYLKRLIQAKIPVRLNGNHWQKSQYWNDLGCVYQGPSLTGQSYSKALRDTVATIGFLSHGNRDLVTQRSFETTACGGLFCAERTSEHQLLYEDGFEALFWDSIDELILQCSNLLNNLENRNNVCNRGTLRVRELGVGNEDICRQVLSTVKAAC